MGRIFKPAEFTDMPQVQVFPWKTGQTFKTGALVIYDTGEVAEAGSNPAAILGVALHDAGSGPGYGIAGSPSQVTHAEKSVSVAIANRTTVFSGRAVNGGTDPVTPVRATHVGQQYGVTAAAGEWYVDIAKTGANARVQIVDIDESSKVFFFKFLEANLQRP